MVEGTPAVVEGTRLWRRAHDCAGATRRGRWRASAVEEGAHGCGGGHTGCGGGHRLWWRAHGQRHT